MDLLLRSYATQGFVAFEVVRTKEKSHCDQHPTNQFFLLTIEVIGCLDKQADVPMSFGTSKGQRAFLFLF
jgi:hypothetical protein